jgi:hypothetical protein
MSSLVLALQQRSPSAETDDTAYGSLFGQIADLLLNRATLFIADHPCRITEIELYFHGLRHLDPFTHNGGESREVCGRCHPARRLLATRGLPAETATFAPARAHHG